MFYVGCPQLMNNFVAVHPLDSRTIKAFLVPSTRGRCFCDSTHHLHRLIISYTRAAIAPLSLCLCVTLKLFRTILTQLAKIDPRARL